MKLNIVLLFLILLATISCRKELLSPKPETSIPIEESFSTPERTLLAVQGMYAGAKVGQIYGGRYLNYQDIRGEDFLNVSGNGVTNLATWNFTVSSSTNEVQNFWNAAYQAINRCNVVIAGVDNAPIPDSLKIQYKAESRFIRALLYHSLVTIYTRPFADGNGDKPGVIIYTDPQTERGNNLKPRAKVSEVYALIIDDLNFAEANLPLTYPTIQLNVNRAHKNSAIALKTRIYLYMNRFPDVITEANKIVPLAPPYKAASGVPHELQVNIANVFGSGGLTTENIMSFPFSTADLPGTQNSLNQYYSPGASNPPTPNPCPSCNGNGDYSLNLSGIINDAGWTASDARRQFNAVLGHATRTWLRKWTDNNNMVPAIRYAEVLLNLAESLAEVNGVDLRAISLLNTVRQRSAPSVVLAPATKTDLINAVLKERRIELLGEGFRSRDLLRRMMPLPAKGSISEVPTNSPQYIWPIPQSELLVNKVEQNPGY